MNAKKIFEYKASIDVKGMRLDVFLQSKHPEVSRSRVKQLIQESHVYVNKLVSKPAYLLKENDNIKLEIPPPEAIDLIPEDIPLEIHYEDEHLLVLNKPAERIVHPGAGIASGTLVHAILNHCQDLSGIGGKLRPGIVHRLDKGTSGAMVVAKHDRAHVILSEQFKSRQIHKEYQAIIWGHPNAMTGCIEFPIGRDPKDRTKISSRGTQTRAATTHYEIIERFAELSLLRLLPKTGRTHQIRVHLCEIGHPIIGDPSYGRGLQKLASLPQAIQVQVKNFSFQLLHATRLKFTHPVNGKIIDIEIPLRDEMADFLTLLRDQHGHQS